MLDRTRARSPLAFVLGRALGGWVLGGWVLGCAASAPTGTGNPLTTAGNGSTVAGNAGAGTSTGATTGTGGTLGASSTGAGMVAGGGSLGIGGMTTGTSGAASGSAGRVGVGGAAAGMGTGGSPSAGSGAGGSSGAEAGGVSGGGASSGGASGGAGTGGGAAEGGDPVMSTGCGKASPQLGSSGNPLSVSGHQYYMKLPTDYDENTAYPVLFMFNPTGNPIEWAEQNAGFESNGAKDAWIRVYPHPANSMNGWGGGDVEFFVPLYDAVTDALCVDTSRAFAAGESSGGDFSSILGCEFADHLRAVAPCATKPVGGYDLEASNRPCTAQVASIVIHGIDDSVVTPANGPPTRDFYRELNHCTEESAPVEGYTDDLSNCVLFDGCDAGYPVYWCLHDDPNYGGTSHGWPAFANDMIFETFSKY